MASIDEIREYWANTAPTPDCCTTIFGKMASEHVATLLDEIKRLQREVEAAKKHIPHRWDETVVEDILKAIIDAYKDVEIAPDESLSPRDAWLMAAGYVAEFTCRELWRKSIIMREEAVPVFEATGGDTTDPEYWCEK